MPVLMTRTCTMHSGYSKLLNRIPNPCIKTSNRSQCPHDPQSLSCRSPRNNKQVLSHIIDVITRRHSVVMSSLVTRTPATQSSDSKPFDRIPHSKTTDKIEQKPISTRHPSLYYHSPRNKEQRIESVQFTKSCFYKTCGGWLKLG